VQEGVRHIAVLPLVEGARVAEELIEGCFRQAFMRIGPDVGRLVEFLRTPLRQIWRTSCTSGIKWRSRFSMP
jgi:hypothetical protein